MADVQTIAHVLTEIVGTYGTDVFREQRKVYSLLSDMAPGDSRVKERRRIKAALESGAVDILLKATTDRTGCELYINESVMRLISQTDMAEEIARDTIICIAEAFSLTSPQPSAEQIARKTSETANTEIPSGKEPSSSDNEVLATAAEMLHNRKRKKTILLAVSSAVFVMTLATMLVGIFFASSPLKYWLLGIGGGIVITGLTLGIAYAFQEFILFNEMCQTVTIALPVLFVANIVLRIALGDASYGLIFRIITVFIAIGAIANAIYTRIDIEDKWTWPNIVVAVCSVFLFFVWPGDFSWTVWQWIIGIGGGLLLSAIVFAVIEILDMIGPEKFISLSVIVLIMTIANFVLLFTFGENYLIIAECNFVILAIGSIIGTVLCYKEAATGLQILNIIMMLLNGGVFLLLVIGAYGQFMSVIQLMLDKLKIS